MGVGADFLAAVYGEFDGAMAIWRLDTRSTTWLDRDSLAEVDRLCEQAKRPTPGMDLYFGLGLHSTPQAGRGGEETVCAIPGVWADIDFAEAAGAKKSRKRYPPREKVEHLLATCLPLRPSVVVRSGGGLHCYWLTNSPIAIDSEESRLAARRITFGWQRIVAEHLKRLGEYEIDSTADLARVLRVPGSWNFRAGREVEIDEACRDFAAWPRYDLSDLEHYAADVAPPVAVAVEGLTLKTDANPPLEKLELLRTNSPEFRRVWDHKKTFPSGSEYEMSLASMAVEALWTDQEIADLIIAHRRRYEPDKMAKVLRHDYLSGTIARARGDKSRDAAIRSLNGDPSMPAEEAAQVRSAAAAAEIRADGKTARAPSVPTGEAGRQATLDMLSDVLGVPVKRWLQLGIEEPVFSLVLTDGTQIDIGTTAEVLESSKAFERALYQSHLSHTMQPVPKKLWRGVVEGLARIRELDEADETKDSVVAEQAILDFLRRKSVYGPDQIDIACVEQCPFIENGAIHVPLHRLHKWMQMHTTDKWKRNKLVKAMKSLGFELRTVGFQQPDKKRGIHRYWRSESQTFRNAVGFTSTKLDP